MSVCPSCQFNNQIGILFHHNIIGIATSFFLQKRSHFTGWGMGARSPRHGWVSHGTGSLLFGDSTRITGPPSFDILLRFPFSLESITMYSKIVIPSVQPKHTFIPLLLLKLRHDSRIKLYRTKKSSSRSHIGFALVVCLTCVVVAFTHYHSLRIGQFYLP